MSLKGAALLIVLAGVASTGCRTTTATTRTDPVVEGTRVAATRYEREHAVFSARIYKGQQVLLSMRHPERCIQSVVTVHKVVVTEQTKLAEEPKRPDPSSSKYWTDLIGALFVNATRGMVESTKQRDEKSETTADVASPECARSIPAEGQVVLHLPGENESRPIGALKDGEIIFDVATISDALVKQVEEPDLQPQLEVGSQEAWVSFAVEDSSVLATGGVSDANDADGGGDTPLVTLPVSAFPAVVAAVQRRNVEQAAARQAEERERAKVAEAAKKKAEAERAEQARAAAQAFNARKSAVAKYLRTDEFRKRVAGDAGLNHLATGAAAWCSIWKAVAQRKRLTEQHGMWVSNTSLEADIEQGRRIVNSSANSYARTEGVEPSDYLFFTYWIAVTHGCPGGVQPQDTPEPDAPYGLDF